MSAEFVANMEDVLDLYAEPHDPQRPVVCFDETSTQLLAETRPPLPPRPGRPLRQDYEYRSHSPCHRSLSRGVGARYILLRTPAKAEIEFSVLSRSSNCHPSKSGLIPLIPITIPTQSAPSPDAMPP